MKNLYKLTFLDATGFNEALDVPTYNLIPCKNVARYLGTTSLMVEDVFRWWMSDGKPQRYTFPVGSFITSKRKDTRKEYLEIYYNPIAYYSDGFIRRAIQWGPDGNSIRADYDKSSIQFLLEPIIEEDLEEIRTKLLLCAKEETQ